MPTFLDPFLSFLIYFSGAILFLGVFAFVYLRLMPYSELKLIRDGNSSASLVLGGALLGFSLPLARAIEQSGTALDLLLWGSVGLIVQVSIFLLLHFVWPELADRVRQDRKSEAVLLAFLSVVIGILNAASMTE